MQDPVVIPGALYRRLIDETCRRYPRKVFGYLLSAGAVHEPSDFILFDENIRNNEIWQPKFHGYGKYFVDHADAGFVATPQESWRVQKEIWSRGLHEIGILHSHQRHPANFSKIDWDMHRQRFTGLWHLIISLRNPLLPQVRAFAVTPETVRELPLQVDGRAGRPGTIEPTRARVRLRELGRLDAAGLPNLNFADEIMAAAEVVRLAYGAEAVSEILSDGLLRGSAGRYQEHIAEHMVSIEETDFAMGSGEDASGHFFGERPRHRCELPAFQIMRVQVTGELFDLARTTSPGSSKLGRGKPVVNVTWAEAALFALWMDCRLPTEAEWEFCCGAGSAADWCCESERDLGRYAWYCSNADDQLQRVATREPNSLGLFDMHGNVWEWCADDYDQDFYRPGVSVNPLNIGTVQPGAVTRPDKVVRGGSMNALAEMCRTRYRFHEQAKFRGKDLGFRLARSRTDKWGGVS